MWWMGFGGKMYYKAFSKFMECNLISLSSSSCPITKKTVSCSDTSYNFLEALAKASKGQHTWKNSHPCMATLSLRLLAHLTTLRPSQGLIQKEVLSHRFWNSALQQRLVIIGCPLNGLSFIVPTYYYSLWSKRWMNYTPKGCRVEKPDQCSMCWMKCSNTLSNRKHWLGNYTTCT